MTRWAKPALLALAAASLGLATLVSGRSPAPVNDSAVLDGTPRLLSEYGFFADLPGQVPTAPIAYDLNVPLYSDGAAKLRFAYVPGDASVETDGDGLLRFPVGSALIKTFAYGEGPGRRLIETRLLLHRADGWLALPYRWNDAQTDAELVLAGARVDLETPDGDAISYRIPNKNQCKECHGLAGEVVPIGPKARNLDAGFVRAIAGGVPAGTGAFPEWSAWRSAPAETAARAYLDVNCAHCHRPQATASNSGLDLRWEQTDTMALGVNKRPVAAGRGTGGFEFSIVPGDPASSIMVHRMGSTEAGVAMPELGKATVDREGVEAVERWIVALRER